MNLSDKGEISDIASNSFTIWAAATDNKLYQFDTRMIRQKKKNNHHILECDDEVAQICFDESCNALFIGDDAGNVKKYDLTSNKISQSVLFHDNALCTAVSTIPSLDIGFCGGTDAMLYQFDASNLENAFSYSMPHLIAENMHNQQSNTQLQINPPFIYALDSKEIKSAKNAKQGIVAMALGNGAIALYAPIVHEKNDEMKQDQDEQSVHDPICCVDMHQSAVCDISFGVGNQWLVSAGTDKFLMINEWKLDDKDKELKVDLKCKIPLNEKPNAMICTSNDAAQIVIADLTNNLSMYSL